MIFIRPYTISQVAVILLMTFLLIYLRTAVQRGQPGPQRASAGWMAWSIVWGLPLVLITMLAGVVEYPLLDMSAYLRVCIAYLFWHAISRAVYALPPEEPFSSRGEVRILDRVIALLFCLELSYVGWRIWRFSQTGVVEMRPVPLELPLLLVSVSVVLLTLRKLWAAEAAGQQSTGERLRRLLLTPQSVTGRFYRQFALAVFGLLGVNLAFALLVSGPVPTWLLIVSDLLTSSAVLVTLYVYLSSPLAPTGLELRMVGAGLTVFLALISLLGWIVTLIFLGQQAPGTYPPDVFGVHIQAQFFVTPPSYRDLARQVSDLLIPLLWFEVAGSVLFVLVYSRYYRRTVKHSLDRIIHGFRQVQEGHLAYRIPDSAWRDEFSEIIQSFNQMNSDLQQTDQLLRAHQHHLQDLVDQRTAELGEEMERRKRLEVRQAVQDERTRIARETHDGLLQTLMGVRIRLNRGKRLGRMEAEALQAELSELSDEISQSMQNLRVLIHDLNEVILPEGLTPALQQLIEHQERLHGIRIHAQLNYAPGMLPLQHELNILRIVQEALANAIRHGRAGEAWIHLDCDVQDRAAGSLRVQIRDNGHGFDVERQPGAGGWGLKNMERRAEQLGGSLRVQSRPGVDTTVDLIVPLQAVWEVANGRES